MPQKKTLPKDGFMRDVAGQKSSKRMAMYILLADMNIIIISNLFGIKIPETTLDVLGWMFGAIVLGVASEKYTKRNLNNDQNATA